MLVLEPTGDKKDGVDCELDETNICIETRRVVGPLSGGLKL
jgi:hypothetical protein